ncbi:hypothetical protein [Effusibacillus lacus]|uniref:Uncharacterized protein n=1 Tax=Effusibacillus lacus TaxID=1348429 RepID=A0A292YT29_9BACL|nr:hypothetical protein [Effusibacillus lacus]TCS76381.1 hypothetical protein EDD64_103148 [Effusibacillus lacus]GAX91923.1 hypothetical protein EFBL_3614 [Effusibacillus lacus]
MQTVETLPFDDWFRTRKGFVGIRNEYGGISVYQYESQNNVKHNWFIQRDVALAMYDELRLYLEH